MTRCWTAKSFESCAVNAKKERVDPQPQIWNTSKTKAIKLIEMLYIKIHIIFPPSRFPYLLKNRIT